jgi:hypothetical protein
MKKLWMIAALFAAVTFAACGGEKKEGEEKTEAEGTENAEEAEEAETEEAETEEAATATLDGKYQLESVSGENLTEAEKSSTITFNADGSCIMNKRGEEKKGTWSMSADGKNLNVVNDKGKTEELKNIQITAEGFTFSEGDDQITFKKVQ